MTYDPRAIANWFLDRAESSGDAITPMKLQKLVYVAHGWHLGIFHAPLVHEAVEAWKWGPVFRSIYREFRDVGAAPITNRAQVLDGATLEEKTISIKDYTTPDSARTETLLQRIWDVYGKFSAAQLSDMTHRTGTPWHTMWERMGNQILPYTTIPNDLIEEHYVQLSNGRNRAGQPSSAN